MCEIITILILFVIINHIKNKKVNDKAYNEKIYETFNDYFCGGNWIGCL